MPPDSDAVYITDGKNISEAHWFSSMRAPITHEILPGDWVNQHYRMSGEYIHSGDITHWIPVWEVESHLLDCLGVVQSG